MSEHRRMLRDIIDMSQQHIDGVSYFTERNLDTEKFRLGYIPSLRHIYTALQEKGWSAESGIQRALELGIIHALNKEKNEYSSFLSNRVIFPIHDLYGRLIGLAGRALSQDIKPKYYNTVFKKSDHLYGLDLAAESILEKNFVIIVEGYTDVIAAHRVGVKNIVATMGTSLTKRHCVTLSRFTKNAFLLFDSDTAGQASAKRFFDKHTISPLILSVQERRLPLKKDLDEMAKADPQATCEFLTQTIIDDVE